MANAKHEAKEMKISAILLDQYRAVCKECGNRVALTPAQGQNGTATCYGEHVSIAWDSFAE